MKKNSCGRNDFVVRFFSFRHTGAGRHPSLQVLSRFSWLHWRGANPDSGFRRNDRREMTMLLSLFFVVVIGSQTWAQPLRKIVIGVSNPDNVTFFPLYLAKESGYFREQGFDPQMIVMNSDLAVKALLTGDVDYAASTAIVTKAAAMGLPVKIIASFFNGTDFSIVAKPEIKTVNELKGRVVSVSRLGSAADFDLREALKPKRL